MALKIIILAFAVVWLSGCQTVPVKLRTETIEVYKPILYCPSPEWEVLDVLAIDSITPETSDGETAVRYKATVKQLQDYSIRLEHLLNQYKTINTEYNELKDHLMNKNNNLPQKTLNSDK